MRHLQVESFGAYDVGKMREYRQRWVVHHVLGPSFYHQLVFTIFITVLEISSYILST
jgi:hypothetical protein